MVRRPPPEREEMYVFHSTLTLTGSDPHNNSERCQLQRSDQSSLEGISWPHRGSQGEGEDTEACPGLVGRKSRHAEKRKSKHTEGNNQHDAPRGRSILWLGKDLRFSE